MPALQLELSTLKRDWIESAARVFSRMLLLEEIPKSFTTDLLHESLEAPLDPNWMGCLMAKLRNQGRVRVIGRVTSKRKEANGRKINVWEAV